MKADVATEAAILERLERWNDGFRRRDLDAVLDLFAPDADVLLLGSEDGEMATGPGALRAFLARVMAHFTSVRWEWRWRAVSAAGDVAWLTADGVIHMTRADGGQVTVPYRISAVFERRGSRWGVMQVHGSEPAGRRMVGES